MNGFRPGREPQRQMSIEEFKVVPCEACGGRRRRRLSWVEVMQHRFNSSMKTVAEKGIDLCMGCHRQISLLGVEVPPEDENFLSIAEREFLIGGNHGK